MFAPWLATWVSGARLWRLASFLLVFSIAMLADGWALVRLSREVGVYLALAIEGGVALGALIVGGGSVVRILRAIRGAAQRGVLRPRLYAELAVVVVATALMVVPGLITDLIGLVLFVKPFRNLAAWILARRNPAAIQRVDEFVKLRLYAAHGATEDGEPIAPATARAEGEQ